MRDHDPEEGPGKRLSAAPTAYPPRVDKFTNGAQRGASQQHFGDDGERRVSPKPEFKNNCRHYVNYQRHSGYHRDEPNVFDHRRDVGLSNRYTTTGYDEEAELTASELPSRRMKSVIVVPDRSQEFVDRDSHSNNGESRTRKYRKARSKRSHIIPGKYDG